MEKRSARVSEAQWNILLDFLENNPNLVKARGYNNSFRGRAESSRLWNEVASMLNDECSGTTKTPKDWSVYVSNYKSKLKKTVADLAVASTTRGATPQGNILSDLDHRFLAIVGLEFDQTTTQDSEEPEAFCVFVNAESRSPSSAEESKVAPASPSPTDIAEPPSDHLYHQSAPHSSPSTPRRTRRTRQRKRPLTPLDEDRRIHSHLEMQLSSDSSSAQALHLIAQNLGRLADAADRYLTFIESQ